MAPLRGSRQDVDIGVGPNLLPHRLGHIPRLCSRCRWRVILKNIDLVRVKTD